MKLFASLPWAPALLTALILGLVLALAVGVLLLTKPDALFVLNARLSRWIDTRRVFGVLDEPRNLERFFYRHHRVLGAFIVLGASFVLWRWAFDYDRSAVLALMSRRAIANGLDWIPAALETALVALHGAILAVGVLVLFRPSLLKGVERAANRWQDTPVATHLDSVVGSVDGAFEGYPRVSGLLLVVTACWCLLALAPFVSGIISR